MLKILLGFLRISVGYVIYVIFSVNESNERKCSKKSRYFLFLNVEDFVRIFRDISRFFCQ